MAEAVVNLDKLPLKSDTVGTRFANEYVEIGTALGLKALGANYMVEEHLFIPKPDGVSERDSWLIGTVINTRAQKSEVCAFDAANITDGPIAVWQADYAWPLGFHGTWAGA